MRAAYGIVGTGHIGQMAHLRSVRTKKGRSPYKRESKNLGHTAARGVERAYGIDLWLRYKSNAIDLVWLKRTCKVNLLAGRGHGLRQHPLGDAPP
jgi:hypothetical protein